MNSMKLYHYAKDKFDILKTKERQGPISEKEHREAIERQKDRGNVAPGYYYQHISFFFEPIPFGISKYYPKDHNVWKSGNTVIEHVVDVSLIKKFDFMIVETPEITKAYHDTTVSDAQYKEIYIEVIKTKYIGRGASSLYLTASPFIGKLEKYMKEAKVSNDGTPAAYKYAAGVPHVMLYPSTGFVEVESTRKIVLK